MIHAIHFYFQQSIHLFMRNLLFTLLLLVVVCYDSFAQVNVQNDSIKTKDFSVWFGGSPNEKRTVDLTATLKYWLFGLQFGGDFSGDAKPQTQQGEIPHSNFVFDTLVGGRGFLELVFCTPKLFDSFYTYTTFGATISGTKTILVQSTATGWYYEDGKKVIDGEVSLSYSIGANYALSVGNNRFLLVGGEWNNFRKFGANIGLSVEF